MVRGHHGGRRSGSRGRGAMPPVASRPKGYKPQGEGCCGICGWFDEVLSEDVIGLD
jgi:hypothetical protein